MIFNPLFIDSETKQINPVGFGKTNGSYLFRDIINVVQGSQSQRIFNSSSILNNILNDVKGLTKTAKDGNTIIDDELNLILQELNLDAGFRLSDSTSASDYGSTTILGSPTKISKVLKEALTKLGKEFSLEIDLPASSANKSRTKNSDLNSLLNHIENLLQEGKPVTLQLSQTNSDESFTLSFNKIKPDVIALSSSDLTKTAYSISIKQGTSADNSNIIHTEGSSDTIEPESLIGRKSLNNFINNNDSNVKTNHKFLVSQPSTPNKNSQYANGFQTTPNTKTIESAVPNQIVNTTNNNGIPIIDGSTLSEKLINKTSGNAELDHKFLASKIQYSKSNPDNILQNKTTTENDKILTSELTDTTSKEIKPTAGTEKIIDIGNELDKNLTDKNVSKETLLSNSKLSKPTSTTSTDINPKVVQTTLNTKTIESVVPNQIVNTTNNNGIPIIDGRTLSEKLINKTFTAELTGLTSKEIKPTAGTEKIIDIGNELDKNLTDKNVSKETLLSNSKLSKPTSTTSTDINPKVVQTSKTAESSEIELKLSKDLISKIEASTFEKISKTEVNQKVYTEIKSEGIPELITKKDIEANDSIKLNANNIANGKHVEVEHNIGNNTKTIFPKNVQVQPLNENFEPKPLNRASGNIEPTQLTATDKLVDNVESKIEATKALFNNFSNITSVKTDNKQTEVRPNDKISLNESPGLKDIKNETGETIVVRISAKEAKSVEDTNHSLRNNFLDDIQKLTEVKRHSFDNIINKLSKTMDDSESLLESLRSVKVNENNSTLASLKNSETIKILDDIVKTNFDNKAHKTVSIDSPEVLKNGNNNTGQDSNTPKEHNKSELKLVQELPSAKTNENKPEKHVKQSESEPSGDINKTKTESDKSAQKTSTVTHDSSPNKVNHTFQAQVAAKEIQPDLSNNITTDTVKINTKEQFQPDLNAKLINEISDMVISDKKDKVMLILEPATLGKIKIIIEIIENKVNARLDVENQAAKEMLQHQVEFLKESLNNTGLQLNSLNISLQNSDQKNSKATKEKRKENQAEKVEVKDKSNSKNKTKTLGYNTYEFIA